MVDQGSSPLSSPLTVQDKGQQNKRKFRKDPRLSDQNKGVQSHFEYPISNLFLEKSPTDFYTCRHCTSGDKINIDIYPCSGWSHWTVSAEAQLENLVLTNLLMILKLAIFRISLYGYDEETATKAILRSGICNGCKDTASNIVDNAVTLLANRKHIDSSRQHLFEDLQQLNKYVLAEMIFVLMVSQPRLSRGDAMWCLFVCDMNTTDACAMATDSSSSVSRLQHDTVSSTSASASFSEFTGYKPNHSNSPSHYSQFASQSQMPSVAGIPNFPSLKPSFSSKSNAALSDCSITNEHQSTLSKFTVEDFNYTTVSKSCVPEEKSLNGKKSYGSSPRRESDSHHKSVHLEKNYRSDKSKGVPGAGIHESSGGFLSDKKCKCTSDFSGTSVRSATIQKNESIGSKEFQADRDVARPFSTEGSASVEFGSKALSRSPSLFTKNTEISPSIPSTSVNANTSNSFADYIDDLGIMFENMGEEWVPFESMNETMLRIVNRVDELKVQLQEWGEWTNKKMDQALRRLRKAKTELKSLQKEKDEVSRLKRDKQTLEENAEKRIMERESALSKANGQVEKDNAASLILETENARMRQERESAKLQAVESDARSQEISKCVLNILKKTESCEQKITVFREDLLAEKRKFLEMQKQVELAKSHLDQLEGKRRKEAKVKDEILLQAISERKQREQMVASAKLKIVLEGEKNMQRYRDQIQMLETQAIQLRLKESKRRDVDRERECIMCLAEEISVVFLPCAHQIICNNCNDLHQKQGMKDCPSCRSPIQQRIEAYHLDPKLL